MSIDVGIRFLMVCLIKKRDSMNLLIERKWMA